MLPTGPILPNQNAWLEMANFTIQRERERYIEGKREKREREIEKGKVSESDGERWKEIYMIISESKSIKSLFY